MKILICSKKWAHNWDITG